MDTFGKLFIRLGSGWVVEYEASGLTLSGDILREKATHFWQGLAEYAGMDCPKWSDGWLSGFKTRHKIKSRRQHGEAGSAILDEACQRTMADIQETIRQYAAEDVYNMDETAYRWRSVPEVGLTTSQPRGRKTDKTRITAALCCNATGSDRLPILYIGKAARPTAFRSAHVTNLESLSAKWRFNKTAWMDTNIMIEWLQRFDSRARRPVLLLMDNFPAHLSGLEAVQDSIGLQFTTVKWLPPNATSVHQPLDQGIIQNWKAHVRKDFVRFMVKTFDKGENPMAKMNVLRAIRWGISAWESSVMPGTIQNCWGRSQCIDWGARPLHSSLWSDSFLVVQELHNDIQSLQQQGHIQQGVNVRSFIDPVEERIREVDVDGLVEAIRHMRELNRK